MDGAVHTYGHRSRKGIYRRWPVQIRFPRPVFHPACRKFLLEHILFQAGGAAVRFVWLLLLLTLVLFMTAEFKKSDKTARPFADPLYTVAVLCRLPEPRYIPAEWLSFACLAASPPPRNILPPVADYAFRTYLSVTDTAMKGSLARISLICTSITGISQQATASRRL